jgi:glycosyltransferase involved in cell wall biosynthesis
MRCPRLNELPLAPPGRVGWPWTEESPALPLTLPDGTPWPRITIVTPSYNQGAFIEETIRSVLLQGYPDLEFMVIDGGSSDNTCVTLKQYEGWIAWWVSEPDGGQSHAINKGFARATGDIITFQNSDDTYLKGAFASVGQCGNQLHQYGIIVGAFYFMDAHSRLEGSAIAPRLVHEGPLDLSLGHDYRLHQVAAFYTRHALDVVGRYVVEDLRYTMDRELLYRVCRQYKVRLSEQAYGAFRRHNDSKSMAQILPFAREFAALPLRFLDDNPADNRKRRRESRRYRAKGYLRYAQVRGSGWRGVLLLCVAPFYFPWLLSKRHYYVTWLKVLGLLPVIYRLKG